MKNIKEIIQPKPGKQVRFDEATATQEDKEKLGNRNFPEKSWVGEQRGSDSVAPNEIKVAPTGKYGRFQIEINPYEETDVEYAKNFSIYYTLLVEGVDEYNNLRKDKIESYLSLAKIFNAIVEIDIILSAIKENKKYGPRSALYLELEAKKEWGLEDFNTFEKNAFDNIITKIFNVDDKTNIDVCTYRTILNAVKKHLQSKNLKYASVLQNNYDSEVLSLKQYEKIVKDIENMNLSDNTISVLIEENNNLITNLSKKINYDKIQKDSSIYNSDASPITHQYDNIADESSRESLVNRNNDVNRHSDDGSNRPHNN